jgi:hypothetical protein
MTVWKEKLLPVHVQRKITISDLAAQTSWDCYLTKKHLSIGKVKSVLVIAVITINISIQISPYPKIKQEDLCQPLLRTISCY